MKTEQSDYDRSVSILEKTIKRKTSEEYYTFLKSGLDRFDNEGDTEKIAKNMVEESVAIERLYSLAMNIAQIDPAIMYNIDHDEAVRLRGKLLGVPKTVLRGKDDVNNMRTMRAEQAQMAQMAQEQQALGKAQKDQAQAAKILADPNVSSGLEDTVNEMGMENIADEYGQRS